jgi:ribose transport system permease protein
MVKEKKKLLGAISDELFIILFMTGVLLVLFVIACITVPNFACKSNVLALLTNNWYLVILGIGATFIVKTGNMDMSLGGIVAMAGVLVAFFCQGRDASRTLDIGLGLSFFPAALLAILCCMVIGLINAFFIARLKVASLIITLGTGFLARGIAQIIARGAQRSTNLDDSFGLVGKMYVKLGSTSIKLSVIIMVVILIIFYIIEKKTVFGRTTYYVGANAQAAKLSGIKADRHLGMLFVINSVLAAIVGIVLASEYLAGYSTRGRGFEFDALCVTLLGGTSIAGGFGSVMGAFIGTMIFSIVTNASGGMLLSPDWTFILKGVVTFLAIVAQRYALDKRNA